MCFGHSFLFSTLIPWSTISRVSALLLPEIHNTSHFDFQQQACFSSIIQPSALFTSKIINKMGKRTGRALSVKKKLLPSRPQVRASTSKNKNVCKDTRTATAGEEGPRSNTRSRKIIIGIWENEEGSSSQKRAAKKARKAENEIKSGQYQLIQNTERIRQWHKKAKRDLMKMSQEQVDMIGGRK